VGSADGDAPVRVAPAGGRVDHLLAELAALGPDDPARPALRQRVVESQIPLVHPLAQRFRGRGEPYDDLVQVGTIGLLNAVDRFDPERGNFTAFAVPTILGEIRRHFRDRGWAMRVPRRLQDLGRRIGTAREELTHSLGRSPTVQELAAHLQEDADLVLEALDSATAYTTVPLPTTPEDVELGHLGFVDEGLGLVEDRATLRPLLARLPARERTILALRFVRGMSQSQIAAEVGVSQMHVSRLLSRSLGALREGLAEEV
jgi:RNA polymerase sigma-B factor